MGCTFRVSLDELRQVGTSLSTTASELSVLGDVRDDYDPILGDDRVRREVDSFFTHWSDGMHRIADHVSDLSRRVTAAVDAYERNEQALVDQAKPSR